LARLQGSFFLHTRPQAGRYGCLSIRNRTGIPGAPSRALEMTALRAAPCAPSRSCPAGRTQWESTGRFPLQAILKIIIFRILITGQCSGGTIITRVTHPRKFYNTAPHKTRLPGRNHKNPKIYNSKCTFNYNAFRQRYQGFSAFPLRALQKRQKNEKSIRGTTHAPRVVGIADVLSVALTRPGHPCPLRSHGPLLRPALTGRACPAAVHRTPAGCSYRGTPAASKEKDMSAAVPSAASAVRRMKRLIYERYRYHFRS